MNKLADLYDGLPVFLQTVALNAYALKLHQQRYGKQFRHCLERLLKTQWYDTTEIEEYQASKLRRVVEHAYQSTDYYRAVMDERKLKPSDFNRTSDLQKLPILNKQDIKDNYQALISKAIPRRMLAVGHTSGTTGSPLSVMWDRNMQIFNNAIDWRQKIWAGIPYGSRIALVLGRPIVSLERNEPPYWQENFIQNQLWMSAFHLNLSNIRAYLDRLERFKPAALEGYPSTMYAVAQLLSKINVTFPVQAVFTSSEPLYQFQRDLIGEVFSCSVFDFYGSAERTLFATQCQQTEGQHINFEYGVFELIDSNQDVIESPGIEGNIVSTSLQNFGMPLLRYQIGDKSQFFDEPCKCARPMRRMMCVATKNEDAIIRPDGTIISPSVLTHPFKPLKGIIKSQIVQTSYDAIRISLVVAENFAVEDEYFLVRELNRRVGSDVRISVVYLDEIKAGPGGKFRWVIRDF